MSQVSGNTKSSGMNKFNLLADIKEDQEISGASNQSEVVGELEFSIQNPVLKSVSEAKESKSSNSLKNSDKSKSIFSFGVDSN